MTEVNWEKSSQSSDAIKKIRPRFKQRYFYLAAGIGLIALVGFLLVSTAGARYYITIDELVADEELVGKNVRISGAVDGKMVDNENGYSFDPDTQTLTFWVANIPNDNDSIREGGGLAKVLYTAVNDPDATRLQVIYRNAEVPELLQHEAQAILEGKLGKDGIFYAESLQLKCPTKYEEENPDHVVKANE